MVEMWIYIKYRIYIIEASFERLLVLRYYYSIKDGCIYMVRDVF